MLWKVYLFNRWIDHGITCQDDRRRGLSFFYLRPICFTILPFFHFTVNDLLHHQNTFLIDFILGIFNYVCRITDALEKTLI